MQAKQEKWDLYEDAVNEMLKKTSTRKMPENTTKMEMALMRINFL